MSRTKFIKIDYTCDVDALGHKECDEKLETACNTSSKCDKEAKEKGWYLGYKYTGGERVPVTLCPKHANLIHVPKRVNREGNIYLYEEGDYLAKVKVIDDLSNRTSDNNFSFCLKILVIIRQVKDMSHLGPGDMFNVIKRVKDRKSWKLKPIKIFSRRQNPSKEGAII